MTVEVKVPRRTIQRTAMVIALPLALAGSSMSKDIASYDVNEVQVAQAVKFTGSRYISENEAARVRINALGLTVDDFRKAWADAQEEEWTDEEYYAD